MKLSRSEIAREAAIEARRALGISKEPVVIVFTGDPYEFGGEHYPRSNKIVIEGDWLYLFDWCKRSGEKEKCIAVLVFLIAHEMRHWYQELVFGWKLLPSEVGTEKEEMIEEDANKFATKFTEKFMKRKLGIEIDGEEVLDWFEELAAIHEIRSEEAEELELEVVSPVTISIAGES